MSDGALRIAITADPYVPVPPTLYGGIERIIHFLIEGLESRGHQVTLFAHPDSHVDGVPVIGYGAPPHTGARCRGLELWQLASSVWARRRQFDVIHSFGRLAALAPVLPIRSIPKIQSYQRPVPWAGVRRAMRLGGDSICFTACSASLYRTSGERPAAGRWRTVFNGVDVRKYRATDRVAEDAPLVYLGKVEPMKGVHVAIEIAERTGRRLVIAGNQVTSGPDRQYFADRIAPALDGVRVRYVGPVDDEQKNGLLGTAAALLFPTFYDEAFGIVMAESMACGTPVIGFANGGVPEVVRHGVNGFLCRDADEAVAAVPRLASIDRAAVRRDCEERFDAPVIVSQYDALYREVVS